MNAGTRRGVLAAAGTASLLAGLIGARSGPGSSVHALTAGAGATSGASSTSGVPPTTQAPATTAPAQGARRQTSAPATTPSTTTPAPAKKSGLKDGTYTGTEIDVSYGYVEVRATVSGGRLTDVTPLVMPSDRSRSVYIAQYSAPILRKEALAAQSANIDAVSGATYTSEGYAESLQAALDKARA